MKKSSQLGISIIELLIAISIFSLVFALSSKAIITGIQGHQLNDDVSSVQGRLQRISEVMNQQLRGTVFGSISSAPFEPNNQQVSFAILDGSGGFQVLPDANNPAIARISSLRILANNVNNAATLALDQKRAMIVNDDGALISFTVNNVQPNGNNFQLQVNNQACANAIPYSNNTLMFRGSLVGFEYNPVDKIIYRQIDQAKSALAFNISDFKVSYLYRDNAGGAITKRNSPFIINDANNQSQALNQGLNALGQVVTLVALELEISAEQKTRGGTIRRTHVSQVDLVDSSRSSRIRRINGVSVCN